MVTGAGIVGADADTGAGVGAVNGLAAATLGCVCCFLALSFCYLILQFLLCLLPELDEPEELEPELEEPLLAFT